MAELQYPQIEMSLIDPSLVLQDRRVQRMDSWVRAFLHHFRAMMNALNTESTVDITGASRSIKNNSSNNPHMDVTTSFSASAGIVVGSGVTAVTMSDNALQTIIANGSGAGQLVRNTPAPVGFVGGTGSSRSFYIARSFTNVSGAPVDVNEIGIYCITSRSGGSDLYCLARDVLGATISVPDAYSLMVVYTLSINL